MGSRLREPGKQPRHLRPSNSKFQIPTGGIGRRDVCSPGPSPQPAACWTQPARDVDCWWPSGRAKPNQTSPDQPDSEQPAQTCNSKGQGRVITSVRSSTKVRARAWSHTHKQKIQSLEDGLGDRVWTMRDYQPRVRDKQRRRRESVGSGHVRTTEPDSSWSRRTPSISHYLVSPLIHRSIHSDAEGENAETVQLFTYLRCATHVTDLQRCRCQVRLSEQRSTSVSPLQPHHHHCLYLSVALPLSAGSRSAGQPAGA